MSLLDTLLTLYMYQNSKNSDPKVTTAPSTPGESFLLDQFKNALTNPSPQRQMAGGVASQFLGNLGGMGPSNFNFVSPIMKGQQFAGGMKMPSFDMSKFPALGSGTGSSTGGSGTPPLSTGASLATGPSSGGGNSPAGVETPIGTIGGVPAAPQYTGGDVPPPTTGTDIMNWLGGHGSALQSMLGLAGAPAGLSNWLMSLISGQMASSRGQNAQPIQSPTVGQWANSPQTPLQLPTGSPSVPNLTPGGGPSGGDKSPGGHFENVPGGGVIWVPDDMGTPPPTNPTKV